MCNLLIQDDFIKHEKKRHFLIHIPLLSTYSSFSVAYYSFIKENVNFLMNMHVPAAIMLSSIFPAIMSGYLLKCRKIQTMNIVSLCVLPFLFSKQLSNSVAERALD